MDTGLLPIPTRRVFSRTRRYYRHGTSVFDGRELFSPYLCAQQVRRLCIVCFIPHCQRTYLVVTPMGNPFVSVRFVAFAHVFGHVWNRSVSTWTIGFWSVLGTCIGGADLALECDHASRGTEAT